MLYLSQQTSEADRIFGDATRRNFTFEEQNKIQYEPVDPNNRADRLRIPGRVARVQRGYCLIDTQDFGRVLCHGTKYGDMIMELGLNLTFQLVFAAKGKLAIAPQPLS